MLLNMAECITGGSHGACTYVAAEGSTIGCMWDGTGCDQGCIPANMVSRCADLSHDAEACDGEQGQELRCKWSNRAQRPWDIQQMERSLTPQRPWDSHRNLDPKLPSLQRQRREKKERNHRCSMHRWSIKTWICHRGIL